MFATFDLESGFYYERLNDKAYEEFTWPVALGRNPLALGELSLHRRDRLAGMVGASERWMGR